MRPLDLIVIALCAFLLFERVEATRQPAVTRQSSNQRYVF